MNFINIRLFYNLFAPGESNEDLFEGSNFMLLGPFVSLNYLRLGNNQPLNTNNVQVNIGLKMLMMFDFSNFFHESSLPLGIQIFNIELGYRFNNYEFNNHQFYFNLSTDILALVALIGIFSGEPEEVKQQKKDIR